MVTGVVQKLSSPFERFRAGNILVVKTTSPEWEPVMRRAKALITDQGSQTSHASLVAREMKLNAIVGTQDATSYLVDGQIVTLDSNDLRTGFVYGGTGV
jgi:pyruvate,water dikinase